MNLEYGDNDTKKTEEHIVAYLDVLGTTDRMRQPKEFQELSLDRLHYLYKYTVDKKNYEASKSSIFEGIEIKIFSDNIIITKKLSPKSDKYNRTDEITVVLRAVSHFQTRATCLKDFEKWGWLIRGAITIGELFIDDTMVWGEALVRAYELENSIAIYPRVVIDTRIKDELLVPQFKDFLLKDSDELYFLNYIDIYFSSLPTRKPTKNDLNEIQAEAQKLANSCGDKMYKDKIYQKLSWHVNYLKRILDKDD